MEDPVFDFYKGFYKKASSWFLGTIIVLVVIAVIGIAYLAISRLTAKNTNTNTQSETTTQPDTDTQMNSQDLLTNPDETGQDSTGLYQQDLLNGGASTIPSQPGSAGTMTNPSANSSGSASPTMPGYDLGY